MRAILEKYIRAGYPGIMIVSHEEERVEAGVLDVAGSLGYSLYSWSAAEGLADVGGGNLNAVTEPLEALWAVNDLPDNTICLFRDLQAFLEEANPVLVRTLRESLRAAKTRGKVLVLAGCRRVVPAELEREITVLPFALPGRDDLGRVLENICKSAGLEVPAGADRDLALDACSGLTTTEAENAFALSIVECGGVDARVVAREKAASVRQGGLLEVWDSRESLDDIGGLDLLKDWLLKRSDAFGSGAARYGLPSPRGLLIIGIPGTGKSLTAKAVANVFGRPLLKLDAGRLYGGLVGQSEANLRSVLDTAEAIAPCVLWLDEIEKGFSGGRGPGTSDGGTSGRVLGSFISWMQEKKAPVFVVATANDVAQLPPEMLRKGRFDELFFVDLPAAGERSDIWRIQVAARGRDPDALDIGALARASDGFTGAEIEQAYIDAMYAAFAAGREPGMIDIAGAIGSTVPLSRLMRDEMARLRKWAGGRCRMAASGEVPSEGRRIVA